MPPTRRRRIVRRAVIALAVCVLLPVWYVGSYLGFSWCRGRGWASHPAADVVELGFAPMDAYCRARVDLPGAQWLAYNHYLLWSEGLDARIAAESSIDPSEQR